MSIDLIYMCLEPLHIECISLEALETTKNSDARIVIISKIFKSTCVKEQNQLGRNIFQWHQSHLLGTP